MAENDYKTLVEKANMAVQGITDPELRRVAFEKILDELLKSGSTRDKKPARIRRHATPIERRSGQGPKGYVEELIKEGFFKKPKTIVEVKAQMENLGHHIPLTSLSGPLQRLCQQKTLRRQKTEIGGKSTFTYSEW